MNLKKVVNDLLKLNWVNVSAKRKELPGLFGLLGDDGDTRSFQTLKSNGSTFLIVEFCKMNFDEGPILGSIISISGTLYDAERNIVESNEELCDVDGRLDHNLPLAKLCKKLWDSVPTPPLQKQSSSERKKAMKELELIHEEIKKELPKLSASKKIRHKEKKSVH